MTRLRAGVIGAGSWAMSAHLPALAARKEVELVAVCRQGRDTLEQIRRQFAVPFVSENYRDLLDQELDIVVVSSPTALHHEHASAALLSGAHVLCEKPMSAISKEAWELVDVATKQGRELLMSFGWNYMPIVRSAVALMGTYGIGEIEHITVHMSSQTRELLSNTGAYPDAAPETLPEQSTWTNPSISGGGYGQAQLSHALGLLLALFPLRVSHVDALMTSPLSAPVELHDAMTVGFDGGAIGVLSGGSSHMGAWGNKHELEIRAIGSEGQFIIDVHRELVWLYRPDGVDVRLDLKSGDGAYQASGPVHALVDVALGRPGSNVAPGSLGARTVEVLELAYASAASGVRKYRETAVS